MLPAPANQRPIVKSSTTKVAMESLGDVIASQDGNQRQLSTDFDSERFKVVYENERWLLFPFRKWTKALLPTDRAAYSSENGKVKEKSPEKYQLPGEEWVDREWRVADPLLPDGWMYALDFSTAFYKAYFPKAFVRRRAHVRAFRKVK